MSCKTLDNIFGRLNLRHYWFLQAARIFALLKPDLVHKAAAQGSTLLMISLELVFSVKIFSDVTIQAGTKEGVWKPVGDEPDCSIKI